MSRLASAIRSTGERAAGRSRNVVRARIVSLDPMRIEPFHQDHVLGEDDFELAGWIDNYHREFGLEEGDVVLMMREDGDWTIFDLVPDKQQNLGQAKSVVARLKALEARVAALEED